MSWPRRPGTYSVVSHGIRRVTGLPLPHSHRTAFAGFAQIRSATVRLSLLCQEGTVTGTGRTCIMIESSTII